MSESKYNWKETHVRRIITFAFLALSLTLLYIDLLYSQDSLRVVILSPRVGLVIDAKERDQFNLFPLAQGFDSAVVLRNSQGLYGVFIMGTTQDGHITDTIFSYTEGVLINIAEKIDHFEEIKNGTYHIGDNQPVFQYGSASAIPVRGRSAIIPTPVITTARPPETFRNIPVEARTGRKTRVISGSGDTITGELLSVRPKELLLSPRPGIDDDILAQTTSMIRRVPITTISNLHIEGESKIFQGMGIGFAAGAFVGGALGFASGDDQSGFFRLTAGDKALIGGAAGGLLGLIVGTIAGVSSSQSEVDLGHVQFNDLVTLRAAARYPDEEPGFLKDLK